MKKTFYIAAIILGTIISLQSCRDSDLEPTLAQQKEVVGAITNTNDIRSALNSAYDRMSSSAYYGRDYIIYGEVRSDNAYSNANSNKFVTVGQMNMTIADSYAGDTWSQIYSVINSANMITNLDLNTIDGDEDLKKHYLGEALVIRALAHFDLVKLYGQQHITGKGGMSALGVPYVTTLKPGVAISPARNTVQEVYDLAMTDLNNAISLMKSNNDKDNHYLSLNAAYAIKARIALYFANFNDSYYTIAKDAAKKVIESGKYNIATSGAIAQTFNTDSTPNQIFSLEYNSSDALGINGLAAIYWGANYGDIVMLGDLYDKYETSDVRANLFRELDKKDNNIPATYRNHKFATLDASSDVPVIRYEEVVLIYSEAALKTEDPTGTGIALDYLNMIPNNRGASPYTIASLENILLERRKEFAGEGFRFYDLVRTSQNLPIVDDTRQKYGYNSTTKEFNPIEYGSYNLAFPIPLREISANANIVQNFGY